MRTALVSALDANGDGQVTGAELQSFVRGLSMQTVDQQLLLRFDTNGDGVVDDDEVLAALPRQLNHSLQLSSLPAGVASAALLASNGLGVGDEIGNEISAASLLRLVRNPNATSASTYQAIMQALLAATVSPPPPPFVANASPPPVNAAAQLVAQQLLAQALQRFDTNGDGVIDSSDTAGMSFYQRALLQAAIASSDRNGDGRLDASDFVPLVQSSLDTNGDGRINLSDLPASLRTQLAPYDTNNDGQIDDADLPAILSSLSQAGDGSLDLSSLPTGLRAALLGSLDANGDGRLDLTDLQSTQLLSHIVNGTIHLDDLPTTVRTHLNAAISASLSNSTQPIVSALSASAAGRRLIAGLDTNADGRVDAQELIAGWSSLEKLNKQYAGGDTPPNQPIDMAALSPTMRAALVGALDANGDGQVTVSELRNFMQGINTQQVDAQLLQQFDTNGDGIVDNSEVLALLPAQYQHQALNLNNLPPGVTSAALLASRGVGVGDTINAASLLAMVRDSNSSSAATYQAIFEAILDATNSPPPPGFGAPARSPPPPATAPRAPPAWLITWPSPPPPPPAMPSPPPPPALPPSPPPPPPPSPPPPYHPREHPPEPPPYPPSPPPPVPPPSWPPSPTPPPSIPPSPSSPPSPPPYPPGMAPQPPPQLPPSPPAPPLPPPTPHSAGSNLNTALSGGSSAAGPIITVTLLLFACVGGGVFAYNRGITSPKQLLALLGSSKRVRVGVGGRSNAFKSFQDDNVLNAPLEVSATRSISTPGEVLLANPSPLESPGSFVPPEATSAAPPERL